MEYYSIVGMVVVCLIACVTTYFSIRNQSKKEAEPLNELNINIVRLTAVIENMQEKDSIRDKRIEKHGEQIDTLDHRVNEVEKKQTRYEILLAKKDWLMWNLKK